MVAGVGPPAVPTIGAVASVMMLPLADDIVSPEGMETEDPGGTLTVQPDCTVAGAGADRVIVAFPALIEATPRFASQVPLTPPPGTLSAGAWELIASSGVLSVSRESPY
jgi:hypothetical protein